MGKHEAQAYRRRGDEEVARLVVAMPRSEVAAIDAWGVPTGMPSRTATIRHLVREGLEAMKTRSQLSGAQTVGTGS